jgi:FkbM family methyltransferase
MLIKVGDLVRFWRVNPQGLLHVGAHTGEEVQAYESAGWLNGSGLILVEAQTILADKLKSNFKDKNVLVLNLVAWDVDNAPLNLNIASNSESTSALNMSLHAELYPDITITEKINVTGSRLDNSKNLPFFDFVNLDIQGAELKALKGMGELISQVKWIYTEINLKALYEGSCTMYELDAFLDSYDFRRCATSWDSSKLWGDALYVKNAGVYERFIVPILYKISRFPVILERFSYRIRLKLSPFKLKLRKFLSRAINE